MHARISWKEWIAVLLLLGVGAAIFLPALARSREGARRSSCANNLKQAGIVMKMFAAEHKDYFPPLSQIPGNWVMNMNVVYPEYVTDLRIFICPTSPYGRADTFQLRNTFEHPASQPGEMHPDCVSGLFYTYTGYSLVSDEQAFALFEAYEQGRGEVFASADVAADVPVWEGSAPPGMGSEGIPVMWDRIPPVDTEFAHTPPGTNVLHHDGHVEFVRYSPYNTSNNFPATRLTGLTFGSTVPALSRDCY